MDDSFASLSVHTGGNSGGLNSQLRSLSLSAGAGGNGGGDGDFLQDEDLSLALGDGADDSFDLMSAQPSFSTAVRGGAHGQDDGEEETLRLEPSHAQSGAKGKQKQQDGAGAGKDVFFGGSMAAAQAGLPASKRFDPTFLSSATAPSSAPAADGAEGAEDEEDEENYEGYSEEEVKRIKELRMERDYVRGLNRVLEGVREALIRKEGEMQSINARIATSHALLDQYARIASQAEHTKDLLLDGEWRGVGADEEYLVAREAAAMAAEAERLQREQEEAERREREAREAEERARREEERRALAATAGAGTRGRGRGVQARLEGQAARSAALVSFR
ncbi:hypothetical protein JCM10213v2_008123 [Rhodosporidiobolus nylandii]